MLSYNNQRSKLAEILAIGIPLLVYILLTTLLLDWIIDDAAISFSYARNLAGGQGLVSQPGVEPVEGFSNPLWIFLITPFFWVGLFHPFITSKVISLVLVAVTFWVINKCRQLFHHQNYLITFVVLVFLATNTSFVVWTCSGLENPLMTFLVIALLYTLLRMNGNDNKTSISAGLISAGIALTRPDGILFAAVFPVILFSFNWKQDVKKLNSKLKCLGTYMLSFAIPFGCYFLFRVFYYNDIFPNTYHVKGGPTFSIALRALALQQPYLDKIQTFLQSVFIPQLWLIIPITLVVWIVVLLIRGAFDRKTGALLLSLFISLFTYLIMINDWMGEYRLATAFFPLILITMAVAINQLLIQFRWNSKMGVIVTLATVTALFAFTSRTQWKRLNHFSENPSASFKNVAINYGHRFNRYAEQLQLENASLLVPDIGGALYYSKLRIYDLAGLCDKTIARTFKTDQAAFRDYVFEDTKPTFIHIHGWFTAMNRFDEDKRFARDYLPIYQYEDKYAEDWLKRKIMSGNFIRKDAVIGKEEILQAIRDGEFD